MANWEALNQNLGGIGKALGEYARQKKAQQDALQMLIMKAQIEQRIKEETMQRNLGLLQGMGFGLPQQRSNVIDTTATTEPNVVQPEYTSSVEPRLDAEGGLSFGFKRELSPQAQLRQKIEETKATELAKGITPDKAGLYNLAKESIKNIKDIKKILFPNGQAKSFKKTTAFASNLPGGSLPGLPSRGWGRAEQDVFRKMGAALSGRQLIQTGVAARPEETQKLISQFAPSLGSNPDAALAGLNELEDFYKNYINTLETRGITGKTNKNTDPLGLR